LNGRPTPFGNRGRSRNCDSGSGSYPFLFVHSGTRSSSSRRETLPRITFRSPGTPRKILFKTTRVLRFRPHVLFFVFLNVKLILVFVSLALTTPYTFRFFFGAHECRLPSPPSPHLSANRRRVSLASQYTRARARPSSSVSHPKPRGRRKRDVVEFSGLLCATCFPSYKTRLGIKR